MMIECIFGCLPVIWHPGNVDLPEPQVCQIFLTVKDIFHASGYSTHKVQMLLLGPLAFRSLGEQWDLSSQTEFMLEAVWEVTKKWNLHCCPRDTWSITQVSAWKGCQIENWDLKFCSRQPRYFFHEHVGQELNCSRIKIFENRLDCTYFEQIGNSLDLGHCRPRADPAWQCSSYLALFWRTDTILKWPLKHRCHS